MDSSSTIRENNYNLWSDQQKQERTINQAWLNNQLYKKAHTPCDNHKPIHYTNIQKVITDHDTGKLRIIYKFSTGIPDGKAISTIDEFGRDEHILDAGTLMNSSRIETH